MTSKWVYRSQMRVRWGDMDAFGHVNNSVYLSYFEQARADWWYHIGARTPDGADNQACGPVVLTANCHFIRPLFYPDHLLIDVYASPPGRSSFLLEYVIHKQGDEETVYTRGSTKIVWVDYEAGRAVRLPQSILSNLPEKETDNA